MGMRLFGNSFSTYSSPPPKLPNPDPKNYEIISVYYNLMDVMAVKIKYPDCTNYEGVKILVYVGTTIQELKSQGSIDPHFCDNAKYKSPIARFEPTDFGWTLACCLVDELARSRKFE